jgi:hypothetical protein
MSINLAEQLQELILIQDQKQLNRKFDKFISLLNDKHNVAAFVILEDTTSRRDPDGGCIYDEIPIWYAYYGLVPKAFLVAGHLLCDLQDSGIIGVKLDYLDVPRAAPDLEHLLYEVKGNGISTLEEPKMTSQVYIKCVRSYSV